jgi:TolB-like protein/DNA-binding winged helix-turn-helix (wHTH) protein/Flp pilus assembly protein TadD
VTMPTNGNFYRFDDVLVDHENFRVQKDGQNVSLTPRAFDVLVFLAKNSGRVVEKQEFFDEVWKETFVSDNALTKIIKEIRHALDDDAGNPRYIETVPKRGYRLIAELAGPEISNETPELDEAELLIQEPEPESVGSPTQPRNYRNRFVLFIGLIVIATALVSLYFLTGAGKNTSNGDVANEPIDSIAVLPFKNVTQDVNAEYLSDGITESLINRLSLLSSLKVASRSAAFRYKGKEQDAQKIAAELNVRSVLTGSVQQVDGQLVINVSLDDARNDRHIWGEQYVRGFSDILDLQNEIAQNVAGQLRLIITQPDQEQLSKHYTKSSEAYDLYLKGQYEWKKHTLEDLQKGIAYYDQALAKDPNFALAYAGIASCYTVLGNNYLPPHETYKKAKAYASKALAIDDKLADAHSAMGAVRLYYDWNWQEAEKELKRAQTLNPNDGDAYLLYGDYLDAMGRFDEARSETARAKDIDSLSAMFNTNNGIAYYYARQYDEAIDELKNTITLEPRFVNAYVYLGQAYEQKGAYAKAIETFEKGMSNSERHPLLISSLGHAFALAGDRDKAQKALSELIEISGRRYVSPYLMAVVCAGLGDKEQTLMWLEKGYKDRSFLMIWLKVEPQFDPLRGDPRFDRLVQRIGL